MSASVPTDSVLVGAKKFAELFEIHPNTATKRLAEWWNEQQRGGPVRVWRCGKRGLLRTTLAVIHRDLPAARDTKLVRKMENLEKDFTQVCRRIDDLTTRLREQEKYAASLLARIAAAEVRMRALESRGSST